MHPFSCILNESIKVKTVLKSSEASRRQFDSLPAASARPALRHRTGTPAPHTIAVVPASCRFPPTVYISLVMSTLKVTQWNVTRLCILHFT